MENRTVKCRIDLTSGIVEIEAADEIFHKIAQEVQNMVQVLSGAVSSRAKSLSKPGMGSSTGGGSVPKPNVPADRSGKKAPRGSAPSAGRPGRIGSFEPVMFGISEAQERDLLANYARKHPSEQMHKIAVAMYFGELALSQSVFDYNEIYSLMRLCGEKKLPKAIDVVLQKMIKENWATREGDGFSLKFLAKDYAAEE